MDGVLVVDKPAGLTSHDVVAAARRALGERRIGHTGTLDPFATGVLPLACGRATRLVRFLSAGEKEYLAVIRFGVTTDSYDVTGREITRTDRAPSRESVERALHTLRGEYLQQPPAFSAKRIGSRRAYALARREEPVALKPVPVTVTRADVIAFDDGRATVALTCSAGFYVRSFAHELGRLTGEGALLESLRRTRSGDFELGHAVPLDRLVQAPDAARRALLSLDELLPGMPVVRVTDEGRSRVTHGRELGREQTADRGTNRDVDENAAGWVRLIDARGQLLAIGRAADVPGVFHPAVVLI
jgi:tRNA pseudouridine55 synthase